MKAMILAAGLGTRMRPLTEHCPKPLLQAGGQALIDFHLHKLAAAGINDVVVNCSWLAEQLVAHLGDGSRYGLRIQTSVEEEPLETAGGIVKALPLLGETPFLLINGDIWTDFDFARLLARPAAATHLVLIDNPPHHPEGDFSLAADGRVSEGGEGQRLTFAGISLWHSRQFSALEPGSRPLKPLMLEAMAKGELSAQHYRGHWWDIGTPQRLAELDRFLATRPGQG